VHGRTTFEARYDGRDRWLHRTFVHLDNRRNRRHRSEDGFVLDRPARRETAMDHLDGIHMAAPAIFPFGTEELT
jgi:hypothetical protein